MSTPVYTYPPYTAANVNLFPLADRRTDQAILPPVPFASAPDLVLSAWQIILQAEWDAVSELQAASSGNATRASRRRLVQVRVVGFLFSALWNRRETLGDQTVVYLAREVVSLPAPPASERVSTLGERYQNIFLAGFRTKTGRPSYYNLPSRPPSFDSVQAMIKTEIASCPKGISKARILSLARDGYSCMVSNAIDTTAAEGNRELQALIDHRQASDQIVYTAHIFHEELLQNATERNLRRNSKAAALAVLKILGLQHIVERLTNNSPSHTGVHSLCNIISLCATAYDFFKRLEMVFDPVPGMEHTYDVRFTSMSKARGLPTIQNRVTFKVHYEPQTQPPLEIQLPDPRLLALHAVCAEVAHMSGAAKVLDEFVREEEEIGVLAQDGGSAELLGFKLARYGLT
ncbi:hypothetical protein MKEN_01429700 [Mycena kentingensis (nom. inval.)]|nr:hypothetical protein MKEN_01429700 [Mycena kentingensis (nom. inval.)]